MGNELSLVHESAAPADEGLPQRYLVLIAEASRRLLAAEAGDAMVEDLFHLIRTELRLDVFINFRFDGTRLLLEAHGGITPAEAAACAVLELGEAVCGTVARDRTPFHATCVQGSDNPLYGFIKGMGVGAYACTPLLHGGELLGTLSFGRRWAECFTPDELNFLHTICHYIGVAKHRQRTEAALRDGVTMRDRLLGELNHRVRNALQLAIALQTLEAAEATDPALRTGLLAAVQRLEVLAAVHRPLYGDDGPVEIELVSLLRRLMAEGQAPDGGVTSDGVYHASIEHATALALLVHGLVSHNPATALVGLRLTAKAAKERCVLMELTGLSPDADAVACRTTAALLQQLSATLTTLPDGSILLDLPGLARRGE